MKQGPVHVHRIEAIASSCYLLGLPRHGQLDYRPLGLLFGQPVINRGRFAWQFGEGPSEGCRRIVDCLSYDEDYYKTKQQAPTNLPGDGTPHKKGGGAVAGDDSETKEGGHSQP